MQWSAPAQAHVQMMVFPVDLVLGLVRLEATHPYRIHAMPKNTIHLAAIGFLAIAAAVTDAGAPAHPGEQSHPGPTPDQAYQFLREGNLRFAADASDYPNTSAARRALVASAQHPFAAVLSCADSRVPVELLFDRGIGDVFVIRVAGNVADGDEIGSLEYAAEHLSVPLTVVMGHSSCGAVKAVASGAEVHGSLPGLVDNIIPAVEWVKKNRPELQGDELVNAAIEANVWQSIDDLISHSNEIRSLLQNKKHKVVGAFYDLSSGKVRWLGEHPYQDSIIAAAGSHDSPTSEVASQHPPASQQPSDAPEADSPVEHSSTAEVETDDLENHPHH